MEPAPVAVLELAGVTCDPLSLAAKVLDNSVVAADCTAVEVVGLVPVEVVPVVPTDGDPLSSPPPHAVRITAVLATISSRVKSFIFKTFMILPRKTDK